MSGAPRSGRVGGPAAAPDGRGRRPMHAPPAAVRMPRIWPVRARDVAWVFVLNAALIVGMWVRHGGLNGLGSTGGLLTAAGQLTGLLGTYTALLQLVLMSRSPWLDQLFGTDRLTAWHRWLGFLTVWLLVGHAVLITAGYAMGDGSNLLEEAWTLLTTYEYVLLAGAGLLLMIAVGVTSVRLARRRLSYETWYFIHLYAYLAIALAFLHQLAVGADFISDPIARLYWIALYAAVIALVVVFRIGQPVALSVRHRLRVANVVTEAPGVVSIYITGRRLDELAVRAGQFFQWRFLAGDGWWRAHPYSISAAPNGQFIRLTVKDLGDDSRMLKRISIGTWVFAEGPYGAFTGARRSRDRVLLVAGGIGVTPLRALVEEMAIRPGEVTLLYRASSADELVFRGELDALAAQRGVEVHYLIGRRGTSSMPGDPLGPASLRRLVPDVAQRDVFICGPTGMIDSVQKSLRFLGVPGRQIHSERFAF